MLAPAMRWRPVVRQVQGDTPAILSRILEDDVNLAIWQRQLPAHIEDFGMLLLALNEPLAESMTLDIKDDETLPDLGGFTSAYADLEGHAGFIADVSWLISAYACLLGAKCIGVRLRVLDKAM